MDFSKSILVVGSLWWSRWIPKVRDVFQFPEELQRLTANLRTVDVSHNKIEVLPASIGNFLQMKSLTLNSNKLSKTVYKLEQTTH